MADLDRVGVFRGDVVELAVGVTSKAGLPQAIVRLKATERYVEDPTEMAHFKLTEPSWVDWSGYGQETVGYFVLINTDGRENFNFAALQRAVGWDGASFAGLAAIPAGKNVLFRMEENTYEGNTTIRPNSIDSADADIHVGLRKMDADGLRNLDAKFASTLAAGKKTAPVAAAKPPAKGSAPAGKPTAAAANGKPPAKPASPVSSKGPVSSPSKGPPKAAPKATPAAEMDQAAAWDAVEKGSPGATDDARAEAWLEAAGEVCPMREEATFTGAEWAAISANALKRVLTPATA
jgi:hypothetical protein